MRNRAFVSLLLLCAALAAPVRAADLTADVDPLIGTDESPVFDATKSVHGGTGNVYPGAVVPFGMVQFGPDTEHPGRLGYSYADKKIKGFSLTHLSGAGCIVSHELLGYPLISAPGGSPLPFDHAQEKAAPGFYSVRLANGVAFELTATARTGLARVEFPAGVPVALDVRAPTTTNPVQSGELRVVGPDAIEGRLDGGNFCDLGNKFTVYYALRFDAPISSATIAADGASLFFAGAKKHALRFKAAVSYASAKNARLNLDAENPGWDFSAVRGAAKAAWNQALGKIAVDGGAPGERRIFYTALYHSLLHPNVFSDVNGEYVGFDRAVRVVAPPAFAQYANFSGWDIYRTQIQLLAALFPQRASDMMQSLLVDADQCGGLPRWPYNNDEAAIMVGDPASALIANAYAFGARTFDAPKALYWIKRGADDPTLACNGRRTRPGLAQYLTSGYVPEGVPGVWGSASTTLEYAVADFAVSRFAASLGDKETARMYLARSASWKNLLDPTTGYLRPKDAAGRGLPGFDPASGKGFVEGNAAQYVWMVPHDFPALVQALGGPAAVNTRLDRFFTHLNVGENFPYFWLGNEPGFATPWLYNWTGAPARAADVIRRSRDEMFSAAPGGLPGNDDLGAMSAWYVWAALGLYPVIPGAAEFSVNPPLFPEARVDLGGRRPLRIIVKKRTERSRYIESLALDGRPALTPSVALADLKNARELTFVLADSPTPWGVGPRP